MTPEQEAKFNDHIARQESLVEDMNEIKGAVKRIEVALAGDEELGNHGLVKRLKDVEKKADAHEKKIQKAQWTVAAVGATFVSAFEAVKYAFTQK